MVCLFLSGIQNKTKNKKNNYPANTPRHTHTQTDPQTELQQHHPLASGWWSTPLLCGRATGIKVRQYEKSWTSDGHNTVGICTRVCVGSGIKATVTRHVSGQLLHFTEAPPPPGMFGQRELSALQFKLDLVFLRLTFHTFVLHLGTIIAPPPPTQVRQLPLPPTTHSTRRPRSVRCLRVRHALTRHLWLLLVHHRTRPAHGSQPRIALPLPFQDTLGPHGSNTCS